MSRLSYSVAAEDDLADIVAYIAERNPSAALDLSRRLDAKCRLLASRPRIGRPDRERPGRRISPTGNYLIIYRETDDGIQVLRIVHGRRNLAGI